MESEAKKIKKIIYTDNGVDRAISGYVVEEDEFFLVVEALNGMKYRIGKKSVVCIKDGVGR